MFFREVTVFKNLESGDIDEPAAKKAKVDFVKNTVKRTVTFVPLQDALDIKWSAEPYVKRIAKMDPSYFLMRGKVFSCFVSLFCLISMDINIKGKPGKVN